MPNPNPEYIDEIKANILLTKLGELRDQFAITGNLSVTIAYKDETAKGETGHAQLILKSGDETVTVGFSPAEGVDGTALMLSPLNGGVPGKFSVEDPELATAQSSEFNFNGATALSL